MDFRGQIGHGPEFPGPAMRWDRLTGRSELAILDWGTSSTDHGHAVSAREYQTDSSSKRPDLLSFSHGGRATKRGSPPKSMGESDYSGRLSVRNRSNRRAVASKDLCSSSVASLTKGAHPAATAWSRS